LDVINPCSKQTQTCCNWSHWLLPHTPK